MTSKGSSMGFLFRTVDHAFVVSRFGAYSLGIPSSITHAGNVSHFPFHIYLSTLHLHMLHQGN